LAYSKAVSEQENESREKVLKDLAENSTKSSTVDILNEDLESPFEEEVYHALTEHFDKSKIIPQYKFAEFRIDMVIDTGREGVPKIAVECDGAKYHSSQEAYLHDRHRQKILEGHGFVFHRIWSTNWWRNAQKETKKLVEFIQNIESDYPLNFKDKSNIKLAFTDNISIIENGLSSTSPNPQKESEKTIEAVNGKTNEKIGLFKETVQVNSKVKVKYLNNGKELKVHLVEQTGSKLEKINGIQKINIKTPLGIVLKGKSVGDTVKIGDLDTYVQILKILD